MKNDHILPLTRVVAFLIIPFLLAAFLILYVQGDETGQRFAWQIDSRLTAAIIGAGYLGGAYFFLRVGLGNRWHRVDPGHWPFQVWLVLYIITPVLLPFIWRRNQRTDPGVPEPGDLEVPPAVRRAMMVIGGLILLAAILMFIFPNPAIAVWAWTLTPLTTRVMAGWQALLGAGSLAIARDGRWSAWPVALQSIGLWQLLVVIAFFLHRQEFGATGLLNWFVLYTVAGLAGIGGLGLMMSRQRPQQMDAKDVGTQDVGTQDVGGMS
jgi:peptidoglycan/LPS O-acetylase OafA/YrhL